MSDIAIPLSEHAFQWQFIRTAIVHQRMPQSLLLVGPRHVGVTSFANQLASILLCHAETKPCHQCSSCQLFKAGTHTDFKQIRPEALGGVIKIDQIRCLQEDIYQTPLCGENQLVLLEPVDRMNMAASNALLKVLEEPPTSVYFILVAEQLGTIPATILSRCQKLMFADSKFDSTDYFVLGEHYAADSPRGKLYAMRDSIMTSLCDVIEAKSSPCAVAAEWSKFELFDFVWFLHLVTAQAIQTRLVNIKPKHADEDALARLIQVMDPIGLLMQLESLNNISRKLSHNVSMNTTLALEDLLIGYYRNRHG